MSFRDGVSGGSHPPRLWVESDLFSGCAVMLSSGQVHYLRVVMRFSVGGSVLVFNGRDGEWVCRIRDLDKRVGVLTVLDCVRDQVYGADIEYIFAPLQGSRLGTIFEKATEMGVRHLRPVWTCRAQHRRLNLPRFRKICIEAAEQCGLLWVPDIAPAVSLEACLADWDSSRPLIFCDENLGAGGVGAFALSCAVSGYPLSVLVGPEGGFRCEEVSLLRSYSFVYPLSLGSRILRGDTACVVSLSYIRMMFGDD